MLYMPISLLLAFKDPDKFYHFSAIMVTMVYFSYQTFTNLNNSPTAPIWENWDGYLGDKVQIIKQINNKALIISKINYDKKIFVVTKNPDKHGI